MNPGSDAKVQPAHEKAVQAVAECRHMAPEDARDYLEMLATAGHEFMRATFGVDYPRGFLESALAHLDRPAILQLREPH